jgi:hypothetical protein
MKNSTTARNIWKSLTGRLERLAFGRFNRSNDFKQEFRPDTDPASHDSGQGLSSATAVNDGIRQRSTGIKQAGICYQYEPQYTAKGHTPSSGILSLLPIPTTRCKSSAEFGHNIG